MRSLNHLSAGELPDFVVSKFKQIREKCQRTEKGCLVWPNRSEMEYGSFTAGGKTYLAHRISFAVEKGDVPADRLVCHSCDVRSCIEPDHLFVGTNMDNSQDMIAKGRHRGRPPSTIRLVEVHARLFDEDIAMIKRIAAVSGLPWQTELRLLLRRSLRGEVREVLMLKETKE